ncbi:MAG: magnesium/cobalt transporter CorA, partial [Bacteroidetes bacterium]|nr:magnesium/cobalt transporter CorA [Bacteroidota bacterium]
MTRTRQKVSALHPVRLTRRLVRRRKAKPAGLPPGTVVYTGEDREGPASLFLMRYKGDDITEEDISIDALNDAARQEGVTWIQLRGVHDVDAVQRTGEAFGLHPLTQEDIVNTEHRAKIEQFDEYLFVILRHLRLDDEFTLSEENVSLILTRNVVLSFSLGAQEIFEPNRERIKAAHGRFRARGADYLFYTLIDSVVDHYVNILETVDDRITYLEEEIIERPSRETVARLHVQRRLLLTLRKAVLPLRDVLMQMQREDTEMIGDDITMFLHDVQDHVMHVFDTIESDRDTIGSLLDLAMAHESNRMNEVMKVLTIIATVFIPLTFIAGVYGMNFE